MADKKVLTPEQEAIFKSLTPEEVEQLKSLLGPDGKVDEAELAKVAGGKMSPNIKKILGWGGAALTAVSVVTGAYYLGTRSKSNPAGPEDEDKSGSKSNLAGQTEGKDDSEGSST